jgi:hypothetical protein
LFGTEFGNGQDKSRWQSAGTIDIPSDVMPLIRTLHATAPVTLRVELGQRRVIGGGMVAGQRPTTG